MDVHVKLRTLIPFLLSALLISHLHAIYLPTYIYVSSSSGNLAVCLYTHSSYYLPIHGRQVPQGWGGPGVTELTEVQRAQRVQQLGISAYTATYDSAVPRSAPGILPPMDSMMDADGTPMELPVRIWEQKRVGGEPLLTVCPSTGTRHCLT